MTESRREVAESIAQRFRRQLGFRLNDIVDLSDAIEAALKDRDERAAKIAVERAAFNRRLAHGSKISDAIDSRAADLKLTRADEAEVIAGEIREGKQSQDYATVRINAAVAAIGTEGENGLPK